MFFYFLFLHTKYKKLSKYSCISCGQYVYGDKNIFELWFYINKLGAFQKIYNIAGRRFTFSSFILCVVLVIFQIPLKLIYLLRDILYCGGSSLNDRLSYIYDDRYDRLKNLKIEFIDKNVFLNCYTLHNLAKSLMALERMNKQRCYDMLKLLGHHCKGFDEFEKSERERIMFFMSTIETKEGVKIPFAHPSYT